MENPRYLIANQITISSALNQAYAHWNAGQAPPAEQLCLRVLQALPYQPDALHLLGIMAHAYGKLDIAMDFLRQACAMPGVPATYLSNLAEIYRQKGLLVEAEQAGQRAVEQEPELTAAWNNLGIILQESGKLTASRSCLEKVLELQPDSAEAHNNLANTYKRLGHLEQAQTHYHRALELHPNYAQAYSNLAFLLSEQRHFDEAVEASRRAIELDPQLVDAYLNLAEIESARARQDEALRWLDALQIFAPQHPGALLARAQILRQLGHDDSALTCTRAALEVAPNNARAHQTLGQILQAQGQYGAALTAFEHAAALPSIVAEDALIARAMTLIESGDKEAAFAAFDRVLQAFPHSTKAIAARADIKKFSAGDADMTAMEAVLEKELKPCLSEQIMLHFALGKAYLDSADSNRAFLHMGQGNALKRATFHYDAAAASNWLSCIADAFTSDLIQRLDDAETTSELPIFIIGMPHSGILLIEQILSLHPQVQGIGELRALQLAVDQEGAFPALMTQMNAQGLRRIATSYLTQIKTLAAQATRLVDRTPTNFLYAALIPLILPGARIIHCRRDAVDSCLSCYSKNFASEHLFAYQFDELGRFHRDYQNLMDRLRPLLPVERFLEIDYETMINDIEGQAGRLIDFIGLASDDANLDFYQIRQTVDSISSAPLHQPIDTNNQKHGCQHADHLKPLLAALSIEAA